MKLLRSFSDVLRCLFTTSVFWCGGSALATLYVWGSKDSSVESVLPFNLYMDSGRWTLVARFAQQAPCPLSYFFPVFEICCNGWEEGKSYLKQIKAGQHVINSKQSKPVRVLNSFKKEPYEAWDDDSHWGPAEGDSERSNDRGMYSIH